LKRDNKHDWLSLPTIFFDSSKLFTLQSRNSSAYGGFKQSRLLSLQFAKNYYRKISDVAQPSHVYLWVFIFSILTLCGCGYTLYSRMALPFDSIQIERIDNITLEPKLQDKLYRALTEEFLKNGVTVRPNADYKLSGTIRLFELHILSEKRGVAVEYEAVMKGDFRLKGPSGETKDLKNIGSPFIVSFSGSGPLEDVLAFKEVASEKAAKDIAMEIVGTLMYTVKKGDLEQGVTDFSNGVY
jgi:hypothetical protein